MKRASVLINKKPECGIYIGCSPDNEDFFVENITIKQAFKVLNKEYPYCFSITDDGWPVAVKGSEILSIIDHRASELLDSEIEKFTDVQTTAYEIEKLHNKRLSKIAMRNQLRLTL